MPTIQEQKRSAAPKRASELDSRERGTPTGSKPLPGLDEKVDSFREDTTVVSVDQALRDKELEDLAFMEEPVEIIIQKSMEKNFPSRVTELVAINGVKAEILQPNGKWLPVGYLPRGVRFFTKRKYIDWMVRAHIVNYTTRVEQPVNEDPITHIDDAVTFTIPLSRLRDAGGAKGDDWWARLMAAQVSA